MLAKGSGQLCRKPMNQNLIGETRSVSEGEIPDIRLSLVYASGSLSSRTRDFLQSCMVSFSTAGRHTNGAWRILACGLIAVVSSGCSNRPPRLVAPKLDPDATVARALESYDSDANGELSSAELAASPGLQSNLVAYDLDGDKKLTEGELRDRIEYLAKLNFALTTLRARVELNGTPLQGAKIEMIPEAHFADQIKPAHGVTDPRGVAAMSISEADLPKAQQGLKGIHTGTYRVSITHPDKQLPAKYNSETTLGYETKIGAPSVVFKLKN